MIKGVIIHKESPRGMHFPAGFFVFAKQRFTLVFLVKVALVVPVVAFTPKVSRVAT